MTHFLLIALLAASPDFPEIDPSMAEEPADVVEPGEVDGEDVAPEQPAETFPDVAEEEPALGSDWSTKTVKPRELTPPAPRPQAPRAAPAVIHGGTARSQPASPAPAAVGTPQTTGGQAFISGYAEALWNDTKDSIQRRYPNDRPLLDKGNGKWMITDRCEGEDANLVFAFDERGALHGVVCQFKRGVENHTPDYPLYKKVREALVKRWGQPAATNESPAPDSPSQAAAWEGKSGKASLVFDDNGAFVQLTVERRP